MNFVLQVDCTVETALCAKHGVTGYPTLKLFKDSETEVKRYTGKRDQESLENFIYETLSDVSWLFLAF